MWSRPAVRSVHSPIQWLLGNLSLVVKRPRREADHPPPSNATSKANMVEQYIHSPIRLHGVVFNWYLTAKTSLPHHVSYKTDQFWPFLTKSSLQCRVKITKILQAVCFLCYFVFLGQNILFIYLFSDTLNIFSALRVANHDYKRRLTFSFLLLPP
jgi:hypothetical protein